MVRRGRRAMTLRALHGIAATLQALAGLAEHAATRSAPVRAVVLWILGLAGALAEDFVASTRAYQDVLRDMPPPEHSGYAADDALAMAFSLRLLALVVQALADEAESLPDTADVSCFLERVALLSPLPNPGAFGHVECFDTS